ncbi:MAG: universal stress protein [Polyangiaceae bacterium]
MIPPRLILVPIDFEEVSDHALEHAIGLASALKATVHITHILQLPVYNFPDASFLASPELIARLSTSAQTRMNAVLAKLQNSGVTIESSLREGVPHEEVIAAAKAMNADLIVMGTHGRGLIAHALLGSVAERVVRTSPVPVLVVRKSESK